VPGTPAIDAASTFEPASLVSSAPKPKSGTGTGEISTSAAAGPHCQPSIAVTYLPGPSGRKISQVISVTVAAPKSRQSTSHRVPR
jgi:hypothetical protein